MYQVDESAYWQGQLIYWGPKVLIALAILVATWVVARIVKWALQKAIDRTPALRKHVTGTPEETVGHQLGVIAKLVIWLVGIMRRFSSSGGGRSGWFVVSASWLKPTTVRGWAMAAVGGGASAVTMDW